MQLGEIGPWVGSIISLALALVTIVRARVVAEKTVTDSMANTIAFYEAQRKELLEKIKEERAEHAAEIALLRADAAEENRKRDAIIAGLRMEVAGLRAAINSGGVHVDPKSLPPPALDEPTRSERREHSQKFVTTDLTKRRK
jgi:cell division protein FtsB